MICFPSFLGSSVQEYARFGAAFRGVREVSALPSPGFAEGEPLAATVEALASVHAENIRRSVAGMPFVLAGHSTGGVVAHAVAARLQDLGMAPAAIVLLESYGQMAYSPGRGETSPAHTLADAVLSDRLAVLLSDRGQRGSRHRTPGSRPWRITCRSTGPCSRKSLCQRCLSGPRNPWTEDGKTTRKSLPGPCQVTSPLLTCQGIISQSCPIMPIPPRVW